MYIIVYIIVKLWVWALYNTLDARTVFLVVMSRDAPYDRDRTRRRVRGASSPPGRMLDRPSVVRAHRVSPTSRARAFRRASTPRDDASTTSSAPALYRAIGYRSFIDDDASASPSNARAVVKIDCGPVAAYFGGAYDGERLRGSAWRGSGSTPPSERDARAFERSYVFDATLEASTIFSVSEERPLGVVFEPDAEGRVRVSEFVDGGKAARANAVSSLAPFGAQCCRRGDILRAFTATQVVYKTTAALTGDLSGTKRVRTLFGADGLTWGEVQAALANGRKADGPITLVLERDADRERAEAWPRPVEEIEFRGLGDESTAAKRERERLSNDDAETTRANIVFASGVAAFVLLILAGFS